MKIAIHHRPGSFSERWIEYCQKNSIDYKIVNAFDSDIIHHLADCSCFLWHYHQSHYKDVKAAKNILFALEHAGIKTFPDFYTAWHFDDKIAQKYLLEALGFPLVNSYIFYDKKDALRWAELTTYPKVFKLKGGAGSANVKLVRSKTQAHGLIHKSFALGFPQFDKVGNLKDRFNNFRNGRDNLVGLSKGIGRLFITPEFSKLQSNEKGYAYFQDFVEGNDSDIRIIVIGNKAFAIKRLVRPNDFRASGSGRIVYDKSAIDERAVQLAFEVNDKIKAQSIAFDFVFDQKNNPLIIEISYGFLPKAYDLCPGFWDKDLNWHETSFNPQYWMIENLINESKSSNYD